jgi:hypothetical protein
LAAAAASALGLRLIRRRAGAGRLALAALDSVDVAAKASALTKTLVVASVPAIAAIRSLFIEKNLSKTLGLNGGLPRGVDFFLVKSDRAARYFRLFIATNFKFSGPV